MGATTRRKTSLNPSPASHFGGPTEAWHVGCISPVVTFHCMNPPPDPALPRQLPIIAKIIRDETWLEGERRGCLVSPSDPVVRANVCAIILRIGAALRAQCTSPDAGTGPASDANEDSRDRHAA